MTDRAKDHEIAGDLSMLSLAACDDDTAAYGLPISRLLFFLFYIYSKRGLKAEMFLNFFLKMNSSVKCLF